MLAEGLLDVNPTDPMQMALLVLYESEVGGAVENWSRDPSMEDLAKDPEFQSIMDAAGPPGKEGAP